MHPRLRILKYSMYLYSIFVKENKTYVEVRLWLILDFINW